MSKTKKSLAVLLAVLMLASFMPLFASAATAMSKANATLVEAPKFKYKDGEATSTLVVPNGTTRADIEIVGGKLEYNGTPVEGFFSWSSKADGTPSTAVLAVGDVAVRLYFHPTDTTNYSRGLWSSTASSPIEGWPTLAVDGLDAIIVEAPTVSGDLLSGNRLNTLTLSGGKVTDADGNDITANGTWSFVSATSVPTESGAQQVQWKCSGYDVPKTTVNVTVKFIQAKLAEAPASYFPLEPGQKLTLASIKPNTGKVVDEDGNDITSKGTWNIDKTKISDTDLIFRDTEIEIYWSAIGCSEVRTTMLVVCKQPEAYYVDALPSFKESKKTFTYDPDFTFGDLTIIPGKFTDKVTGEEIPGTYSLWTDVSCTIAGEDRAIGVSTKYSYGLELCAVYFRFDPADSSLPSYQCGRDGVYGTKADFTLTADSELVLNYGAAHKTPYYGNDLRFSTLKTEPEKAGVYSISWKKDIFDPATADYGSVTYVEVTVRSEWANLYNDATVILPIRIQNFVHDGTNLWYMSNSNLEISGMNEESYDGIKHYKVDFTNKRLKGNVDVVIGGEVVASVSPDENGKFFAEGTWTAKESGDYEYYFEYKPSEEDTATVTNPVVKKNTFTIELRPYHTLTVITKDKTYTITERVGNYAYFDWRNETGLAIEDFTSWTFTDENGNAYTPVILDGDDEPTTKASIYIKMPDHDVTATLGGAGSAGDGSLGSLWDFWQKLINFIIEIYTQIMNIFVPSVEQGW